MKPIPTSGRPGSRLGWVAGAHSRTPRGRRQASADANEVPRGGLTGANLSLRGSSATSVQLSKAGRARKSGNMIRKDA
jgi:hypothetical protein